MTHSLIKDEQSGPLAVISPSPAQSAITSFIWDWVSTQKNLQCGWMLYPSHSILLLETHCENLWGFSFINDFRSFWRFWMRCLWSRDFCPFTSFGSEPFTLEIQEPCWSSYQLFCLLNTALWISHFSPPILSKNAIKAVLESHRNPNLSIIGLDAPLKTLVQ